MDTQLKRGLLEACVLASLTKADSYGYQIVKDVPPTLALTESTLYPILKRLESGGLLSVYSIEYSSRLRKYYRLTDAGRRKVDEFIDEWQDMMEVYEYIRKEAAR